MDIVEFAKRGGITLRSYQEGVARAVVESVLAGRGLSLAVMFPRQSGKNEAQAQIEAFLLWRLQETDAELVKISPTWRPQAQNAMRRLERVLARHPLFADVAWKKESGYLFRVGRARMYFFSGAPEANIVGATASTLLEVDEAQDVRIDKFDRDIAPMAASQNATRVFWGTAWTSRTLLAREIRAARERGGGLSPAFAAPLPEREAGCAEFLFPSPSGRGTGCEATDGVGAAAPSQLAFVLSAEAVAREVAAYGAFVAEQVAKLGRNHPMVKTQYFSEEIDAETGMFPPERVARMRDRTPHPAVREKGGIYAFLVDVAGEDEGAVGSGDPAMLANPRRDATALTVVRVDLSTLADPLLRAPTYCPVLRKQWVGVKHADLYGEIRALAEAYRARRLVIDATGVGAGLASFLERALPGRVIPHVFTQASKSRLGWGFLKIVDEGRWVEDFNMEFCEATTSQNSILKNLFFTQLSFCQSEVLVGPGKIMKWGVPDGTRDPATGEWVHDDLVVSAALCARLDEEASDGPPAWGACSGTAAGMVRARDPLEEIDRTRF